MSNALTVNKQAMALPVVADDLNGYMAKIATIELLTPEEEQSLARRLRESDDLDAARQLVMSQLRFVVHIARSYKGYGLPLADLVQEGNIGLMKAVKRFEMLVYASSLLRFTGSVQRYMSLSSATGASLRLQLLRLNANCFLNCVALKSS